MNGKEVRFKDVKIGHTFGVWSEGKLVVFRKEAPSGTMHDGVCRAEQNARCIDRNITAWFNDYRVVIEGGE